MGVVLAVAVLQSNVVAVLVGALILIGGPALLGFLVLAALTGAAWLAHHSSGQPAEEPTD